MFILLHHIIFYIPKETRLWSVKSLKRPRALLHILTNCFSCFAFHVYFISSILLRSLFHWCFRTWLSLIYEENRSFSMLTHFKHVTRACVENPVHFLLHFPSFIDNLNHAFLSISLDLSISLVFYGSHFLSRQWEHLWPSESVQLRHHFAPFAGL